MYERFSEEQREAIRKYYLQNYSGARDGNNARGEPLNKFDIFAKPPRVGAKNAIERCMADLPEIVKAELKNKRSVSGCTIVL